MTDKTFTVEDYKRKIAGLLAKAEATDNEAEQKAFSEKAEALMIKMGIARAELESEGKAVVDDIVEVHRVWTTIYAPTMEAFTGRVGRAYGDMTFLQTRYGKDRVVSYIIGHKSDVEQYQILLESLHVQVFSALKAFRKENKEIRRYNSIHENFVVDRSFIEGYAAAVARRLHEMKRSIVEEANVTPGAALVLASKQDRVDSWVGEKYPVLRKGRATNRQQSWAGREAGARAGKNANLGGKGIGQQGRLGR